MENLPPLFFHWPLLPRCRVRCHAIREADSLLRSFLITKGVLVHHRKCLVPPIAPSDIDEARRPSAFSFFVIHGETHRQPFMFFNQVFIRVVNYHSSLQDRIDSRSPPHNEHSLSSGICGICPVLLKSPSPWVSLALNIEVGIQLILWNAVLGSYRTDRNLSRSRECGSNVTGVNSINGPPDGLAH